MFENNPESLHLLEIHNLLQFPKEKNALPLRLPCLKETSLLSQTSLSVVFSAKIWFRVIIFSDRLHDPGAPEVSLKFLQTEVIFAGQDEGAGEKVTFGCLRASKVLFQVFTVSFEVFHHQVFAAELK